MEGGQGGRWHQRAVWSNLLRDLTTGLIWLVTREDRGRRGRWPMEGGQGGRWGGGTREQRARGEMGGGSTRVPLLGSLKNLTTGLIWLVTRGRRGEVAHGGRAGGEMGGGTRKQCGSNKKVHWFFLAKAWGGWPREEMGAPESSRRCLGGEGEGVWKWYQGRRE